MKILIDSTVYSKKNEMDIRDIAKNKFKDKNPNIKVPIYTSKVDVKKRRRRRTK